MRSGKTLWDLIVVGGGATGLGTALDAAARGYKTLLLEQHDFSKGTSSRSTKLIHGGVRYLREGDFPLVREALNERALLMNNAPHLVHPMKFLIPGYSWWEKPFYGTGIAIYDLMAGRQRLGRSAFLDVGETLKEAPSLLSDRLRGSISYYDGQFDDARLAISLMRSIFDHGGIAVNYMRVNGFLRTRGRISGVTAVDTESGELCHFRSRAVVNATGAYTDLLRRMDQPDIRPLIQGSQGVHLVVDKKFHPGNSAVLIPKTRDGRVLFMIPWHNRLLIGTTDTPVRSPALEPSATEEELDYLITHVRDYLTHPPSAKDISSVFTGLRPLVRPEGDVNTQHISRGHLIRIESSGLVTVTGGKWTTYRKMAEETVERVIESAGLTPRPPVTETVKIHGWTRNIPSDHPYTMYGSDANLLQQLEKEHPGWEESLHPSFLCRPSEIIWAVRHEMARTVEDVLARRTRSLFLDAKGSIEISGKVASLIASERNLDKSWVHEQVEQFRAVAVNYLGYFCL